MSAGRLRAAKPVQPIPAQTPAEMAVMVETQRLQLFKASAVVDMCRYACTSKFEEFDPEQLADALQVVYDLIAAVAAVLEAFEGDEATRQGGVPNERATAPPADIEACIDDERRRLQQAAEVLAALAIAAEYDANDVDVSAWVIFFGFVNTHQRHARHFRGASQHYLLALNMSVLFGSIVGLGLLGYYFMQVAWYWPVVLFVAGSFAGGLLFGLLDVKVGQLGMSILAFIGWPASAVWVFFIVRGLHA